MGVVSAMSDTHAIAAAPDLTAAPRRAAMVPPPSWQFGSGSRIWTPPTPYLLVPGTFAAVRVDLDAWPRRQQGQRWQQRYHWHQWDHALRVPSPRRTRR